MYAKLMKIWRKKRTLISILLSGTGSFCGPTFVEITERNNSDYYQAPEVIQIV